MIRRLGLLLTATAMLTACFSIYFGAQSEQIALLQSAASRLGSPLRIPDDRSLSEPGHMYQAIVDAATATRTNVVRTVVSYSRDERETITYFVLLTGPTGLTNSLSIASGRLLTPAESEGKAV